MENKVLSINKSDWNLTKLGDLAKDISNRVDNPAESKYDRFVGLENFVSGDIKIKTWKSTKELASSAKAFQRGDILFARRNAYLRRASIVDFDGCCSGDAFVLRENHDKIVPGFLAFLMNSNALWDFANSNAAGTMSKRVKWRDLANYEFPLPPKEEQAKLAELLWTMDEMLNSNLKSFELINIFYRSTREYEILKQGDSPNLFFNNRLKEEVNEDIRFVKLDEILTDIRYGTSKKGNNVRKGYPVLGIPNVVNEKLSLSSFNYVNLGEKEMESCRLKKGDIVIVRTNGNPEYTGKSALYNIIGEHTFASYLIKVSVNSEIMDPEFLIRFLQTKTARRYFRRHATSTAGNYNINTETIKGIMVPLIEKDKQLIITLKLKEIERNMEALKDGIVTTQALQKSLINQIF